MIAARFRLPPTRLFARLPRDGWPVNIRGQLLARRRGGPAARTATSAGVRAGGAARLPWRAGSARCRCGPAPRRRGSRQPSRSHGSGAVTTWRQPPRARPVPPAGKPVTTAPLGPIAVSRPTRRSARLGASRRGVLRQCRNGHSVLSLLAGPAAWAGVSAGGWILVTAGRGAAGRRSGGGRAGRPRARLGGAAGAAGSRRAPGRRRGNRTGFRRRSGAAAMPHSRKRLCIQHQPGSHQHIEPGVLPEVPPCVHHQALSGRLG